MGLTTDTDWEWWVEYLKGMWKPLVATLAVLMAVVMSYSQKLGLGAEMGYSIVRAFLQLSLIGFILQFIFNHNNGGWILLAYLFMIGIAHMLSMAGVVGGVSLGGYTAGQRAKFVPRGKFIAGVSILVGTAVTLSILILMKVFPFTPRYIIPVTGMMVGSSMRVTGVAMKKLRDDTKIQLNAVETALALGATPRQAGVQQVERALIIALCPVFDSIKTMGLISLPGAMSGLILGGASPLEAIQVQIVLMNMLIGSSAFSSIMSTFLCWPGFFTKAYQLETSVFSSG